MKHKYGFVFVSQCCKLICKVQLGGLEKYALYLFFFLTGIFPVIKLESCLLDFEGVCFIQVGEALPLADASVDAIVGTLVLCSVKDVNMALKGNKACTLDVSYCKYKRFEFL